MLCLMRRHANTLPNGIGEQPLRGPCREEVLAERSVCDGHQRRFAACLIDLEIKVGADLKCDRLSPDNLAGWGE